MEHQPKSQATTSTSGVEQNLPTAGLGTLARGSTYSMVGLLGGAVLQYGYNVWLARYFGAEATGNFVFVLSIVSIATIIGQLGSQELLLRYVGAYRGSDESKYIRSVIQFGLLMGLVGTCVATLVLQILAEPIANWADKETTADTLRLLAWICPTMGLTNLAAATLQGAKRLDLSTFVKELGRPLAIVLALTTAMVASATFDAFLEWITWFFLLLSGVGAWIVWQEFTDDFKASQLVKLQDTPFREWAKFGLSVVLLDVFRATSGWMDTVILGFVVSATDVALYFAAIRTSLLITISLGAFNAILAPMVASSWHKGDIKGLESAFRIATKWTWLLVLPISAATLLIRQDLMLLFGEEFAAAGTILLVVLLGRMVNGLTGGVGRLLMMTGHERTELINSMVSIFTVVVGTIWAANEYGIIGAAAVNASVIITINLVKLIQVYLFVGVQPYDLSYLKLLVSGVAGLACGFAMRSFMGAFVIIGVPLVVLIGFMATSILIGVYSIEERTFLKRTFERVLR